MQQCHSHVFQPGHTLQCHRKNSAAIRQSVGPIIAAYIPLPRAAVQLKNMLRHIFIFLSETKASFDEGPWSEAGCWDDSK